MLIRNATVYTLSSAISAAVPFLLLPMLTRALTPQEYGVVSMFTVFSSTVAAVFGLGVNGAINVSLFDQTLDRPGYVGTAIQVLLGSTLMAMLLLVVVSPWIVPLLNLSEKWLFIAAGMACGQLIVNVLFVIWQVEGSALKYGALQISVSVVSLLLSLLLVLTFRMNAEGRLIGLFAPIYVASIGCGIYLFKSGKAAWRFSRGHAADVVRFGLTLMPHSIGYILISMADRMIISAKLGSHDVGIYMASMQLALGIGLMADAVSRALSPWIYKIIASGDPEGKVLVVRTTYLYFAVLLMAAASLFLLSPYFLMFLGDRFRNGGEILAWVGLGSAFSGMYLLVVIYIFYEKRNELLSAITVSIGLVNLPLCYFMVAGYGVAGAAKAYAFSQLMMFILVWIVAQKCHPMPWKLKADLLVPKEAN